MAKAKATLEQAAAKLVPGVKLKDGFYDTTIKFTEKKYNEGAKFGTTLRADLKELGFKRTVVQRSEINGKTSQGVSGSERYTTSDMVFDLYEGKSFNTGTRTYMLALSQIS